MIPVRVAKTQTFAGMGFEGTGVILLDEQRQRALPLWLYQPGDLEGIALHTSLKKDVVSTTLARPRTLDLLAGLLKTLGGELEEIHIDLLQHNVLYAQIYLRNQSGRHTIKALLDDALPLAIKLNSTINVADTVPERNWVDLVDQGSTLEQQLAIIMHTMQTNPAALFLKREPRNLDFTDGLQGWQFMGDPECFHYSIDKQTTCTGKASLAIELRQKASNATDIMPPASALFHHEGFLAEHYRGQRLRMITRIKAEYLQQLHIHLTVSGPPDESASENAGTPPPSYGFDANKTVGPLTAVSDWTRHEVVTDIPHDAFSISYHFIIEGECKFWLDDIHFEVQD